MINELRSETKKALENIIDVIACGDGGIRLTTFLSRLREIDRQATKGNTSAEQVIDVMLKFSRMCDILTR
jgi:GTPase involved in cell partitioning and DNA repair